jgi:hypothetical protein
VYFDNFFTSFLLLTDLREIGVYACGTLRSNRRGYPAQFKGKIFRNQMARRDYHVYVEDLHVLTCTLWSDTSYVTFASNIFSSHGNDIVVRTRRNGEKHDIPAPSCVKPYNKHMGAIDEHDRLLQYAPILTGNQEDGRSEYF